MTYTSVFGAVVSRDEIERNVLSLFSTPPPTSSYPLIVYYLAEVERQLGLAARTLPVPPGTNSYRGGLDYNTFTEEWAPQITVIAEPISPVEREEDGKYGCWFSIQVAALVTEGDEDSARTLADRYGAALMMCLAGNAGLGTRTDFTDGSSVAFTNQAILQDAPETTFPNPRMRRLCQSTLSMRAYISPIVTEPGPLTFNADPYTDQANWPTITTVDIQLQAEQPDGTLNTPTGVILSEPSGSGTVNVQE